VLNPNLIDFSFENTPLSEVISRFAEKKGLNVIFPTREMVERVTFKPDRLLTLDEAERYLYLFLSYAKYAFTQNDSYITIIASDRASRASYPLFVISENSVLQPTDLPDSDTIVRAIYYVKSLKVDPTNQASPIFTILKELLSSPENVIYDATLNAVVITDRSRIVRNALQLLRDLDKSGKEMYSVTLQLYNSSAVDVVQLLQKEILQARPGGRALPPGSTAVISPQTYALFPIRVVTRYLSLAKRPRSIGCGISYEIIWMRRSRRGDRSSMCITSNI